MIFCCILLGAYIYTKPHTDNPINHKLNKYRNKNNGYPSGQSNGWYFMCYSSDVSVNSIKSFDFNDRYFVVYRNSKNIIGILDAFCPHMGTNLSNGEIINDNIVCPYHEWAFNTDGINQDIPYM